MVHQDEGTRRKRGSRSPEWPNAVHQSRSKASGVSRGCRTHPVDFFLHLEGSPYEDENVSRAVGGDLRQRLLNSTQVDGWRRGAGTVNLNSGAGSCDGNVADGLTVRELNGTQGNVESSIVAQFVAATAAGINHPADNRRRQSLGSSVCGQGGDAHGYRAAGATG